MVIPIIGASAESEASCWMLGQCKDETSLQLVVSYCVLEPHNSQVQSSHFIFENTELKGDKAVFSEAHK